MKEARHKRMQNVLSHLYEVQEQAKTEDIGDDA